MGSDFIYGLANGGNVYDLGDPSQAYDYGYYLGKNGHKLEPHAAEIVAVSMGWNDAQGDDYLAAVAPPKVLDLSHNPKLVDEPFVMERGEQMEWEATWYKKQLVGKSSQTLKKWYKTDRRKQMWVDKQK